MKMILPVSVVVLAAALVSVSPCQGQPWIPTRVADSNTPVPGGGTFVGLGERPFHAPSLGPDGRVSFWALYNQNAGNGVFSNATGALETVANLTTIIPGTSQPFATLSTNTGYGEGAPTFSGGNGNSGGVYERRNGQLVTIVDTTTPPPGGGGPITGFHSRDGQRIIVASSSALYQSNAGVLSHIAGVNTPAPGGGMFTAIGRSVVSGASLAFEGVVGSRAGVFGAEISGEPTFSLLADTQTPIPNGTGNFRALGFPSISQNNVAFIGSDQQLRPGVYARIQGQLLNIADTIHPGPGGIQFNNFNRVAISGDTIAFTASTTTAPFGSLFVFRNGELSRVVSAGDTLNGLIVDSIFIGPESLKGDTIAFAFAEVGLGPAPRKGGVYTATYIPGPGVMGVGAAAALAAAARRSR